MKICVFGAGAVGGHLAARLANAGHEVSIVARKSIVEAVRARGLTLKSGSQTIVSPVRASVDAADIGTQDIVFVTLKATAVKSIGESLAPLCGPQTLIVFVVNGIPWWYLHRHTGAAPQPDLSFLDPGGRLKAALDMGRLIGSVVFSANEVEEPGVVVNRSPTLNMLTLGELDGSVSPRVSAISQLVMASGFGSRAVPDIRRAVWEKLCGSNLAALAIGTIIGKPLSIYGTNPELLQLAKDILLEGIAVAHSHGIELEIDLEAQFDDRKLSSPHKPSMLQDFERNRPLEIDVTVIAVQKFARTTGIATPHLDSVTALLLAKARDAGLYP